MVVKHPMDIFAHRVFDRIYEKNFERDSHKMVLHL